MLSFARLSFSLLLAAVLATMVTAQGSNVTHVDGPGWNPGWKREANEEGANRMVQRRRLALKKDE